MVIVSRIPASFNVRRIAPLSPGNKQAGLVIRQSAPRCAVAQCLHGRGRGRSLGGLAGGCCTRYLQDPQAAWRLGCRTSRSRVLGEQVSGTVPIARSPIRLGAAVLPD